MALGLDYIVPGTKILCDREYGVVVQCWLDELGAYDGYGHLL
jgi:hypothetical protein